MTPTEKSLLDANLKNFDSFVEFHEFLYAHNIEYTLDEWEEFRDKLFKLIRDGTLEPGISNIKVNTHGLILPNSS
jgi:hypothetical protein